MAGFRWIKKTEDDPPADNVICACPCGCGRRPDGGAPMCKTCAYELCQHE